MDYALALLPVAVVMFALVLARTPVWAAALLGFAAALVQLIPDESGISQVEWDKGASLLLIAALVVVPGLALNGVLKLREVHGQLADWVHAVPLSTPWKTCLIVLGIGPALESLTGFGISLLATVPVLLAMAPPGTAVRQAVLGMAIVPWGALALPTKIGAGLSGFSPSELGVRTAFVYLLLMPVVGGLATALGEGGPGALHRVGPGAVCGLAQALVLVAANAWEHTVIIAGVLAGAVVSVLVLLPALVRRAVPPLPGPVLVPYTAILATVVLARALRLEVCVPVGGESIPLLTSPGLGLVVALLTLLRRGTGRTAARAAWSSWRPLCAIGGFVLMAEVMRSMNAFEALTAGLTGAVDPVLAVLSPVMALVSGFLTGSATSANAFMMKPQDSLGDAAGLGALPATVQNAGAGIAMLASLPTASLVLSVAGLSGRKAERELVAFDLRLLGVFAVLLVGVFAVAALTVR
ncbi:hypothetical protein ACFYE2_00135 [Kocuria sp. CPCC 205300]|uniref:hypothetical protein n=1 Tax=Kocuria sabuli TaxID=3071448 RepID=UPI0036DE4110